MSVAKPKWFSDDHVMVSTAPTCGLTKGGRALIKVDPITAKRIQVVDPDTGANVDAVNDQLLEDMEALVSLDGPIDFQNAQFPGTLTFVPSDQIGLNCAVPVYYDRRYPDRFHAAMKEPAFEGFASLTLGDLVLENKISVRGGHGSPSQEQRIGEVPYIKVSDLRAGLVNINPTNRVPRAVAERFWRGKSSGLQPFDLICPERTSKNIGDFCVLMPGQEQVLVTKEVIVMRPGPQANFDVFYLLWAMTLKIVRDQWRRIVFMQTNREDVGKRYLEIEIPVPPNPQRAKEVSQAFREYFVTIADARTNLQAYLASEGAHHFYVSGAEEAESEEGVSTGDEAIESQLVPQDTPAN